MEYSIGMIPSVLQNILPDRVLHALERTNTDMLCELRLRSKKPITVANGAKYYYLSERGLTNSPDNAITLDGDSIEQILIRACDKSMYAVNDKICQGFLTLKGGVRIGIAGETVLDGTVVKTVKHFTGLAVRIPHEVTGCADVLQPHIRGSDGYYSTLVISPPGAGKTTLLRDMTRIAASDKAVFNVLIADERNEIAAVCNGSTLLNIGINCDVISGCTKEYAFMRAIRALKPDIIVTDELCGAQDVCAVENAITSGVRIFASVHADNHLCLQDKSDFSALLQNKYFRRYIDISNMHGPGTINGIYDENFCRIG